MKKNSIIKVALFGGFGAIIVGVITGQWIKGIIFCLVISSIGEFLVVKRNDKNKSN